MSAVQNRGGGVSPGVGKGSPLLSQLRTTSNGQGSPGSADDHLQFVGSPVGDQSFAQAEFVTSINAKNAHSKNNATNGLAMSQTRTTTHTSNQHNSGGNVGANIGVG